jgi:hypothetical protein
LGTRFGTRFRLRALLLRASPHPQFLHDLAAATRDEIVPGLAATGKQWKVEGADFHEYRHGLISRLRIVFNLAEASQQLGLRLAPGSRAQRIRAALQRVETRCKRG